VKASKRSAAKVPASPSLGKMLKRAEQSLLWAKSAALKPSGLTLAQYVALAELERQPGITAATLARACLVTPQAILVVLKSMEEQGLISRVLHPRHANVLELGITAVGRESLDTARKLVEPLEKRILGSFSAREQAALRKLLERFINAVEEDGER
jgi:DNA-binding MarR family transcriptional regulator